MATLIDSSLWVDYFRPKTPAPIRQQVAQWVDSADAAVCEPIRFEILRAVPRADRIRVEQVFATLPVLPTPKEIWARATALGQACADAGIQPRSMDLLIAAVCLHYDEALVTFDSDFAQIGTIRPLKVRLLVRGG
ncbi:MAG: PIN domain-containing protein [Verrucomicrobiota bacterium]|jgi:predicted nucleic acid-binding protein